MKPSLDDGNQRAHAHLGFAAFVSGDPERGIAEMSRAVELNPNNTDLLDMLGNSLAKAGELERAVAITRCSSTATFTAATSKRSCARRAAWSRSRIWSGQG